MKTGLGKGGGGEDVWGRRAGMFARALLWGVVLAVLSLPRAVWSEVYQFVDSDGTLVVTNRSADLPKDGPFKVLSARHRRPTGRMPVPASPATITIVSRPAPAFIADRGTTGVRFETYEVCAGTAAGALRETLRKGPYDSAEGRRYPGQTRWSMGWGYEVQITQRQKEVRGGVKIDAEVYNVDVYADVEVILPRIEEGCRIPEHERRIWNKAIASLREHEMDHVNLVLNEEALDGMAASIAGVRQYAFSSGGTVDSRVRRSVQKDTHHDAVPWVKWIREINDEYDRVTDHGLKAEHREAFFRSLETNHP